MPQSKSREDYISPGDAAEIIGCHRETVLAHIKAGLLAAHRPLGYGRGKPVLILRKDAVEYAKSLAKSGQPAGVS